MRHLIRRFFEWLLLGEKRHEIRQKRARIEMFGLVQELAKTDIEAAMRMFVDITSEDVDSFMCTLRILVLRQLDEFQRVRVAHWWQHNVHHFHAQSSKDGPN